MRSIVVWEDDAEKLERTAERYDVAVRAILGEIIELYWDDYTTYHKRLVAEE